MEKEISKQTIINDLQTILSYRNSRQSKQELPINFAERLLSLSDRLNVFTRETKSELKKTTEEIVLMKEKLAGLQNVSEENEEAIYQSQIIMAEGKSLLMLNPDNKDLKEERKGEDFEFYFNKLKQLLDVDYKELRAKMHASSSKKELKDSSEPCIIANKAIALHDGEMPLTGAELLGKIKDSGKLLKLAKSSITSAINRHLCSAGQFRNIVEEL